MKNNSYCKNNHNDTEMKCDLFFRIAYLLVCNLLVAILFAGCAFTEVGKIRSMPIGDVDLSGIADGVYPGNFIYGDFNYQVEVSVKAHRITNVEIINNRDSDPARKAEGVIERVIQSQSPNVDAISGATTVSKVLLKAIEKALRRAL